MVDHIKCQGKNCKRDGCSSCGGYGTVLVLWECRCKKTYWARTGAYTMYEGKEWTTFDGLKMVCSREHGSLCEVCYEKALDAP